MTPFSRHRKIGSYAAAVMAVIVTLAAVPTRAADDDVEVRTKRARNGGGLRIGTWDVRGLETPSGGSSSEGLAFQGYFQKGLDLHLAWENTIGFWNRKESFTDTSPVGGGATIETKTYVVPTLTALKLYPTRPSAVIEPYLMAGLGLVLALDRSETSSTDPFVPSSDETALHTGLGLTAGLGLDWKLSRALGLTAGGGYQWVAFGEDVAGDRTYEGIGVHGGLTYRFQYE
jgi:outer membrane protein W